MSQRVMIIGCGRTGAMVTKALLSRGDEVTILDVDPENFRRLTEQPRLQMVVADGTSDEELRRSGIEGTDVLISLTSQDTINALTAQSAQLTFHVGTVVCRINDPIRREMYESFGLRTVSPPQVVTDLVIEAIER